MSSTLVSIRNLTKTYQRGPEKVEVLHGIDLDIPKGDFVALMGPSGSGKTTLLNLIGGLDSPTGGEIEVDGQRIDTMSSGQLSHWRSNHVGFVFQFYNLMPMLTAQKNVELPLLLTKLGAHSASAMRDRTGLGGLADHGKNRTAELSGGQQHRVAIARAIVSDRPAFATNRRRPSPSVRRRDPGAACRRSTESTPRPSHGHHDPKAADHARHTLNLEKGRWRRRTGDGD